MRQIAQRTFFPWLRRGLAVGIGRNDRSSVEVPRPTATAQASVVLNAGTTSARIPLVGPGDIVGLDPAAIVGVFPAADDLVAEHNLFATVEFDQADLPWRYTPARAASDKLTPWLALVVLAEGEFQISRATVGKPLSTVTVAPNLLPNPSDLWGYAHLQYSGQGTSSQISDLVRNEQGLLSSRLISTRLLAPNVNYQAFIVPTFARGRLAGRGTPPLQDIDALAPAWDPAESTPIDLPIYYSWRFRTSDVGSFRDAVLALQPAVLPSEVGIRDLDVSVPGFSLPSATAPNAQGVPTPAKLRGAIVSVAAAQEPETPKTAEWTAKLTNFLNTSGTELQGVPGVTKVVAPPLYGRWLAAQTGLNGTTNPPWFFALNSAPEPRVAGGLGTTVVQENQQDLLAAAWQQVDGIRVANVRRRMLQVGRSTLSQGYKRHLISGGNSSLLSLTSQVHGLIARSGSSNTVYGDALGGRLDGGALEPFLRRFVRKTGHLAKRLAPQREDSFPNDILELLNDGFQPAPEPENPDGLASDDKVYGANSGGGLTPEQAASLSALGSERLTFWGLVIFCQSRAMLASDPGDCWWWLLRILRTALSLIRLAAGDTGQQTQGKVRDGTLAPEDVDGFEKYPTLTVATAVPSTPPVRLVPGTTDSADGVKFKKALKDLLGLIGDGGLPLPSRSPLQIPQVVTDLKAALNPETSLQKREIGRTRFGPNVSWNPRDPLEPLIIQPEFRQPMWEPLRELSPHWIIPGLDKMKPNTVGIGLSNQKFIESYMVGLNHEMTRELIWNEFPVDQRATFFRQFWDPAGYVVQPGETPPGDDAFNDIKPIKDWLGSELGQNTARTLKVAQVVLLIRGDLIRRYPNVIVYAQESQVTANVSNPTGAESYPVFTGLIKPDVAFYGFNLTVPQVRGDDGTAGWFFVLQEQPGEIRFGQLDEDSECTDEDDRYQRPMFRGDGCQTADNSASFANIIIRRPTRVAIHASRLVPPEA